MTLRAHVSYNTDPLAISVQGMTTQIHLLGAYTDNIAYADQPGYQRRVPVITSFAEYLGQKGVDMVTDSTVGRVHRTDRPLDFALNTKGYFQKLQADGRIELTRDGRFKLDNTGRLVSDDNLPVLSKQGTPIQFPFIPADLHHVKVKPNGQISVKDPNTGEITLVAELGIASTDGKTPTEIDVRQKHVEESNVFLHEEFVGIIGPRRSFQANRQIFLTQSQVLSRLIQEMGRAQ